MGGLDSRLVNHTLAAINITNLTVASQLSTSGPLAGVAPAYGHTPSFAASLSLSCLFVLSFLAHAARSIYRRRYTSAILACAALLQAIGWAVRAWAGRQPYNSTAFLLQLGLLLLGPSAAALALFLTLVKLSRSPLADADEAKACVSCRRYFGKRWRCNHRLRSSSMSISKSSLHPKVAFTSPRQPPSPPSPRSMLAPRPGRGSLPAAVCPAAACGALTLVAIVMQAWGVAYGSRDTSPVFVGPPSRATDMSPLDVSDPNSELATHILAGGLALQAAVACAFAARLALFAVRACRKGGWSGASIADRTLVAATLACGGALLARDVCRACLAFVGMGWRPVVGGTDPGGVMGSQVVVVVVDGFLVLLAVAAFHASDAATLLKSRRLSMPRAEKEARALGLESM